MSTPDPRLTAGYVPAEETPHLRPGLGEEWATTDPVPDEVPTFREALADGQLTTGYLPPDLAHPLPYDPQEGGRPVLPPQGGRPTGWDGTRFFQPTGGKGGDSQGAKDKEPDDDRHNDAFVSYKYKWDVPDDLAIYFEVLDDMAVDTRKVLDALDEANGDVKEFDGEFITKVKAVLGRRIEKTTDLLDDLKNYRGAVREFVRDLRSYRQAGFDIRECAERYDLEINRELKRVMNPGHMKKPEAPHGRVVAGDAQALAYEQAITDFQLHTTKREAYQICKKIRAEADDAFRLAKKDMRAAIAKFVENNDEVVYDPDKGRYERKFRDPNHQPGGNISVAVRDDSTRNTMRGLIGGRGTPSDYGVTDQSAPAAEFNPRTGKWELTAQAEAVVAKENADYQEALQNQVKTANEANEARDLLSKAQADYTQAVAEGKSGVELAGYEAARDSANQQFQAAFDEHRNAVEDVKLERQELKETNAAVKDLLTRDAPRGVGIAQHVR